MYATINRKLPLLFLSGIIGFTACEKDSSSPANQNPEVYNPVIVASEFSASITNSYLPMTVGTRLVYEGSTEDGIEHIEVEVLDSTTVVMGVDCRIVRDRVWEDGELVEDTWDWFAQHSDGSVWYFGEASYEYEAGVIIGNDGSWTGGVDGALPGIVMQALPAVGQSYRQEYYLGEAEDWGEVVAVGETVIVEDESYSNCIRTEEWTPLEPGVREAKYYAPGIGLIMETALSGGTGTISLIEMEQQGVYNPEIDPAEFSPAITNPFLPMHIGMNHSFSGMTEDGIEQIELQILDSTVVVMGVDCRIVRDRAWEEGELVEDTYDYFAQDEDGNVWYFGEASFEIEDGEIINMDGSWRAGVDGALPGIVMPAQPLIDLPYRQEYYPGEAEDWGMVVSTSATVQTEMDNYTDCIETEDWTPLEPGVAEHKFYAEDMGLVKETKTQGGSGSVELTAVSQIGEHNPQIDSENFSSELDHAYMGLETGRILLYAGESDGETEQIRVEVLDSTIVVMGVECRVVRDRVWEDGDLVEDTWDWYAQDNTGNVWNFGEASFEIEDGEIIGEDGSWEAGVDGALPGIVMPAYPQQFWPMQQEYYAGEAEDMGMLLSTGEDVETDLQDYEECWQFEEWTPLEPGVTEHKFYAEGVGMVLETAVQGGESRIELVEVLEAGVYSPGIDPGEFSAQISNGFLPMLPGMTHVYEGELEDGFTHVEADFLDSTTVVMGVECRIVHVREWLEGNLIEETWDWFAQDSAGNVWYFGEATFEIEDGEIVGSEGSWTAGVEGGLPGLEMPANPLTGVAYRKEYLSGVAEDWAMLLTHDASTDVPYGSYSECRKTEEWTPLEPDQREIKFYAAGIGLVHDTEPDDDGAGSLELVAIRSTE